MSGDENGTTVHRAKIVSVTYFYDQPSAWPSFTRCHALHFRLVGSMNQGLQGASHWAYQCTRSTLCVSFGVLV